MYSCKTSNHETDLMHQSISTRRNSWIHLFSNSSWIPRARNDCKKSYNSLFHIWSPSDETSLQNLKLFCWKLLRSIFYTFCSSQPFHILEFFSEMSLPKKRAEIFPDKRHQLERIDGDRHSHVLIYGSQNQSTELGSGNRHFDPFTPGAHLFSQMNPFRQNCQKNNWGVFQ